jgi:hypothetical protein
MASSEPPDRGTGHRRLATPGRGERRAATRSRSRSPVLHLRREPEDDNARLHMLERELRRERETLRNAEGQRCSYQRDRERRSTSRRHRGRSTNGRSLAEQHDWRHAEQHAEHHAAPRAEHHAALRAEHHAALRAEHHAEQRAEHHAEQQAELHAEQQAEHHAERRDHAGRKTRSRSPSFSKKDFFDIFKQLRDGLASQPLAQNAQQPLQKIDHKNILPNFDPSTKNQRMDIWLKKVNECAAVYGWDERTTTHFAMQKLQGLAKTWYESLNTILFTWQEWQTKLLDAFPCDQNYGQILEDMIKRKSKFNEPIEVYYYEKLSLINQCDIVGKRAADCIIHGITDRTLRSGALALRCAYPDQLLPYLISYKESNQISSDRFHVRNRHNTDAAHVGNNSNVPSRPYFKPGPTIGCYNCKEKGHSYLYCTKPVIKCTKCNRVGHIADNCHTKLGDRMTSTNTAATVPKTMRIDFVEPNIASSPSSKFMKDVLVQGSSYRAFIDFGSDVTLIRESTAKELGISHDQTPTLMKGFGNDVIQSLGSTSLDLSVDGVGATVTFRIVNDNLLEVPVLVGQSFTEQPHISVYKDMNKLQFFNIGNELPCADVIEGDEYPLEYFTPSIVELHGVATVRVETKSAFDGSVLIKHSIAGKPNQQYVIGGGLHSSVKGRIHVLVAPCARSCQIRPGTVFCRAEQVDVVHQVVQDAKNASRDSEFDENKVQIGEGVSDNDRDRLLGVLKKYQHCFATSLKGLGCTNAAEMGIELNSQRPVVYRPYRLSHHEREKVRSMVGEMLDAGIVRESVSDYASPILLVRKKDGSMRLCVDYRKLNSVTVKERYPMPIIEDEIARLSGQSCFITLDLASGYYQVPISEQSRHLTSFVTPDGQFEFNRMPFGLANAPAVFQRMINAVLGSTRFSKATAYIDDILIYGKDISECLERLEEVLKAIENANLTLNLSKCDFLRQEIDYLGYEISAKGVRPGKKKILSVANFPRPENVHNVRQFLGLAGYFRKFVRNFAQVSFPLSKLLKKDTAWEWSDSQEQAFEALKSKLVERPVLSIYDPAAETELHTDASRLGVGGILLQRSSGSEPFHPVAYFSRQTSPEEKNFHSYELETLAVVCALRKFRVYLLGREFKIVTDCSALRSTFSKRDLIPRIARWWLTLQEFDCCIEYRAGAKMSHVDALSRNPIVEQSDFLADQFPIVMSISEGDWLHTLQLGDSELNRIRTILSSGMDEKGLRHIRDNYVIRDNKLYRYLDDVRDQVRWVVPKGARWQLCRLNHDEIGHFGVEKTLERIKKNYWFPGMTRFVKKYVNACLECAYGKKYSGAREGLLHPIEKVEVPFHTIHVDHLGPFVKSSRGYTHLFVIVDGFTKFCFLKPVRNTNTQNSIRALEDVFSTFRNPDRLISDRGSCFTSHAFKRFCLDKGIKHILNAVASPRSNGQVERYNRTILDSLRTLSVKYGEKSWDSHLGRVQWGLNNTIQKTVGRAPSEIMFGTCMRSEVNPTLNLITRAIEEKRDVSGIRREVKARIDKEQSKQKDNYDKGRKPARVYGEGELVKITKTCFNNDGQSKKLMPPFMGPYRVTKVLGMDRYSVAPIPGLSSANTKRPTTVAADRMRPWINIAALELNKNDADNGSSDDDDIDYVYN